MVHSITKPQQPGGISHLKMSVPTNNPTPQWEAIYDPKVIEEKVLQHHRQHFAQAKGAVFMQEPLRTLINNTCTTPFSQQILAGTAKIDTLPIDKYTKDLLHRMKSKVTATKNPDHPLDPDALIQGFKKWPG